MPRILVVEDDPVATLVYSRHLEHAGYTIEVAGSGLAAIEQLETKVFEAVVTDLLMPKMDGQELCERIRSDERWADVPIFVVTGVDDAEELAWIDDYPKIQLLGKPLDVAHLLDALGAQLEGGAPT